MSDYTAHDPYAFYRELFSEAVDFKATTDSKRGTTVNINNSSEVEIESKNPNHQPPLKEEFLEVINYPSPNYEARRRAKLPVFASVTSYF